MHIPCPNCTTGWVMPEVGHTHLRACPLCHGTGYLTDQGTSQGASQGSEQEVALMRPQYGEASVEQGVGQGVRREPEADTYSPSFDPQTA